MKKLNLKAFLLTFCLFALSLLLVACEQTIGALSINSSSERSVEKGSCISISITRTQIPTDAVISWLTNKSGIVTLTPSEDNHTCEIEANQKGVVAVVVTYSSSEGQAVATVVVTVLDTAGDLSTAKASKISALSNLLDYDEDDYLASDWQDLSEFVLAAENDINALSDIEDVQNFDIEAVKAQCDGVVTIAGHTAAELAQAKQQKLSQLDDILNEFSQTDYTPSNWEILKGLINEAKTTLSEMTTLQEVAAFSADEVEVLCDEVGVKMTYTVTHLFEALAKSSPVSYDLYLTQTLEGSAGETTNAAALSLSGFEPQTFSQSTLERGGVTKVEIKYNRQTFLYSLSSPFGSVKFGNETPSSVQVRFGSEIFSSENFIVVDEALLHFEIPENSKDFVYNFTGWTVSASPSDLDATERTISPNISRQVTAAQLGDVFYSSFLQANHAASASQTIILHSDLTIESDLEVLAKISLSQHCLTVAEGTELVLHNSIEKGTGSLVNNGTITSFISSRQQYLDAAEYSQNIILEQDIFTNSESRIVAEFRDYSFILDLNGFNIFGGALYFVNRRNEGSTVHRFDFSVNVTVKDSSGNKGGIGSLTDCAVPYGIVLLGDSKMSLTLDGITSCGFYGGLSTNGTDRGEYSSATITAQNSHFIGGNPIDTSDRLGAYLPANHIYTFTDCTFEGASGIHIKSGILTLINCLIIANGVYADPLYYGNGANVTGNALMVEPTKGYDKRLEVTISGGQISSQNGYAIAQAAFNGSQLDPDTKIETNILMSETDVAEYGVSVAAQDCILSGLLGEVCFQNPETGCFVSSYEQLCAAFENGNPLIFLASDIEVPVEGIYQDLDFNAYSMDHTFILDLGGHHINGEVNFRDKDDFKIEAIVKNGEIGNYEEVVWYGILMSGTNLNLTFENIVSKGHYGGIYSNGTFSDSIVCATACEFSGKGAGKDSLGSYLAANFTYTFTDCSFEGEGGGIHIKSGDLTLNNCTLIATGEYNTPSYHGNGANSTGNALMVEPTKGYFNTLLVKINGGILSSVSGFAIEEKASAKENEEVIPYATAITVIDATLIFGKEVSFQSENEIIFLTNCTESRFE